MIRYLDLQAKLSDGWVTTGLIIMDTAEVLGPDNPEPGPFPGGAAHPS
jgi:hypothetical protein